MSHVNYRRKNPVARVLNQLNKPQTMRDRAKYNRKDKYRFDRFSLNYV